MTFFQNSISRITKGLILGSCFGYSPLVRATDLVPPGVHAKAAAGGGQTVSRGPSAIFFNPANLIFSKRFEPSLDVGFSKIDYTYTHSDAENFPDPVGTSTAAPAVTAGAGIRLVPSFAFGFALTPKGLGNTPIVLGVPLNQPGIESDDGVFDYFAAESGFRVGVGAAYRPFFPLTIGLGAIYDNDSSKQVQVALADEPPFLDMKNSGSATQFIGGIRSEILERHTVIALSVKTPAEKKMKGEYVLSTPDDNGDITEETLATATVEYLPLSFGIGAEAKISQFGIFFDYVREQWSGGQNIARFGLEQDPSAVDYVDTNNFSVGAKLWFKDNHMLMASFGIHGSNIGDGSPLPRDDSGDFTVQEDEETDEEDPSEEELDDESEVNNTIGGMTFGNTQGISRMIFAGGYRYRLFGRGYLELAFQFQKGERIVPQGFPQEGTHSLSVLVGSAGLGFGF